MLVQVQEFDEVAAEFAPGATRAVLSEVALARAEQDDSEGYFRDFADTSADMSSVSRSPEDWAKLRRLATSGKRPWLAQLAMRVGAVEQSSDLSRLRSSLLAIAELCVAWVEALDRRELENKPVPMKPRAWWRRLWSRITGRK
jgi:hypothetical protein